MLNSEMVGICPDSNASIRNELPYRGPRAGRHNRPMPFSAELPHVYAREIQSTERTSLNLLAEQLESARTILDLGCGTGALGRWLTKSGLHTLDGVTLSDAEAQAARQSYRNIVVADLETIDLGAHFRAGGYDAIVCADVLEHLKDPASVLAQCRELLAPHGRLLISVPNAAYAGLVAELMHGEFRYREEGLLDRTHLRFFTRRSLLDFLNQHGWQTQSLNTVHRELHESEFAHPFDALPPAVCRYLLTQPDALTYQFVVEAVRQQEATAGTEASGAQPASRGRALFSAELLWCDGSGYSQAHKTTAAGEIGLTRQQIRFQLPAQHLSYRKLRLDPADRPGYLYLHDMRLESASGATLWQWPTAADIPDLRWGAGPDRPSHDIHWSKTGLACDAPMLLLLGDDPWLELPVDPAALTALSPNGGSLHVTLGWPMSADYLRAAESVNRMEYQHALLEGETERLAAARDTLMQQLARASGERDEWRERTRQALEERTRAVTEHQAISGNLEQTRVALEQLRSHLQWIENSTVFRMTRPLVKLKMALTRTALSTTVSGSGTPTAHQPAITRGRPPVAHPVDVIVPVYKGLEDTRRCILSALASLCETPWRLVVINDASPEPAVTQWLRDIAASEPRMVLLENPENLGFVGTVNRGMALSADADVLLLNSDTEVANDWLDRLCAAAYRDDRSGTVTPFSNNATICSYPRFCEPNTLPDGHTTASMDALCAATNPGAAVDVPTGIGFCMYIRRACLDDVGLFDVPNFGKGYGEENDFCRRAHAKGWRNLHALDTFVLHAGGVSFGASKSQRELDAMETLRRLHPDYESEVMKFIALDPAQPYRRALDIARLGAGFLPTVLSVVHDRAGGTLRHVRELGAALAGQAHMLVLSPVPGARVRLGMASEKEELALDFSVATQFDDLVALLRSLPVGTVHFHHLLGHDPIMKTLPSRLGVPYDFTAHDHYSYCPQISLTDHRNQYCGEEGLAQCTACLSRSPAPGGVDIITWRDDSRRFLQGARHILAPSADIAQRMNRFVPGADVRHAPHLDMPDGPVAVCPPLPEAVRGNAPLKVVVMGALSSIKGADLLEATALLAARLDAPVEFHLIGFAYRSLRTQPRARLTVHGEYSDADLPRLLEWLQPDVAWFPAQWPETYSYTLSACLAAGLPVAAPDLGAFPERLAGRDWSWVLPWNTPADGWLAFFTGIYRSHVLPGIAPQPCAVAAPQWASPMGAWRYRSREYLPLTRTASDSRGAIPLDTDSANSGRVYGSASWLSQFLPSQEHSKGEQVVLGIRRTALMALVRLRSAPGLRNVAQAIPLRWQTRLKNWLVG